MVAAHVVHIAAELRQGETAEALALLRRASACSVAASTPLVGPEGAHLESDQGADSGATSSNDSCGGVYWEDLSQDTKQHWQALGWNAASVNPRVSSFAISCSPHTGMGGASVVVGCFANLLPACLLAC
jgi:hypothetical protein